MKLKEKYTLAELGGDYVAVPLGGGESFHGIVRLNESGAEVFRGLNEGQNEAQIVQRLMEQYKDLDIPTARKAVAAVIKELKKAGLLED